jgi:2'-5' RNA ligase
MHKYFIGIGLLEKEERLILLTKQQFPEARVTTTPPHITLVEPFYYENENKLIGDLENWAKKQSGFEIKIEKVGSFKQLEYGTIFLAAEETEELNNLQSRLVKDLDYLPGRGDYVPHLTIANGVDFKNLDTLIERLKEMGIKLKLEVDRLVLYRMEKGGEWKKYREIILSLQF